MALSFGTKAERESLLESFAVLITSGVTPEEVFDVALTDSKNSTMRKAIAKMRDAVEGGAPLWSAMEQGGIWPKYVTYFVRIGEQTGTLAAVLSLVADMEEKRSFFQRKIVAALAYPLVVMGATVIAAICIAWFILPRLVKVFTDLHVELPWQTKVLIVIGNFLTAYGAWAVPLGLVLLLVLTYFIFYFPRTNMIGQAILWRIPPVRSIMREGELARLCVVLHLAVAINVPLDEAFLLVSEGASLHRYNRAYHKLSEEFSAGATMKEAFETVRRANDLFTPAIIQLFIASGRAGNTKDMLERVGMRYEERMDVSSKNLSVLLEPFMLIVVWLGVLMLALAVIQPIYKILGGIHR